LNSITESAIDYFVRNWIVSGHRAR